MFGITNPNNFGTMVGDAVSDDISNLTQPQNSEQSWRNPAAGGGLAGRPKSEDYLTRGQIRSINQTQLGGPPIGAPPGTDIRSPQDIPGQRINGGVSLGGKFDTEADWRSVFGPKKTPGQVAGLPSIPRLSSTQGKPLGMNSVMAAMRFQHNLLHSLGVDYTAPQGSTLKTMGVTPTVDYTKSMDGMVA
jgi:hypothetical protein